MSKPRAYYNDFEPYVCEWLRNLIKAGLIPDGDVDNRSIRDVQPEDLRGYTQCHFFAGIGGWAYALRLAHWPDDREVWTGSCPCQPFSTAGKQKGFEDDRHLWPDFFRLISQRRPAVVFGEQVTGATEWLQLVRSDLETVEYALGAMPLEAASAGAEHARDRFYWVAADTNRDGQLAGAFDAETQEAPAAFTDAHRARQSIVEGLAAAAGAHGRQPLGLDDSARGRCYGRWLEPPMVRVVHGVPARVGQVRAYGNAIYPPIAAEFIGAYLDAR